MPRGCSFGCVPRGDTMHSFPNPEKFPDRFKTWVKLVGGKLESNEDYECFKKKKICDIHFTEKDRNRFRRLNALAVPSLHLPGTRQEVVEHQGFSGNILPDQQPSVNSGPSHYGSTEANITMKINYGICNRSEKVSSSGPFHSGSSEANIIAEHNYSSCSHSVKVSSSVTAHKKLVYNSAIEKPLRKQIIQLRSEICRLKKKHVTFKGRLSAASKCSRDVKFQQVAKNMTEPARVFMHMQLQSTKLPKGRRFSLAEKILSLSLYKKSPKCYGLLCKYFTLPSVKSMKRLVGQIKITEGINDILFEKIKKTMGEKDVTDRLYSLIFDEMSLTPHISYNHQKDQLDGFTTHDATKFADHVLVFMIKNIKHNIKQPVAYYFTNSLTKITLKKVVKEVITKLQYSNVIIINTVCDQSAINTSAISELVEETRQISIRSGEIWRYDHFKVNSKEIIPIYDAPHLIKGIRNNLLTKDLTYESNNNTKCVKWEHFQKVYVADKSYCELRLLDHITEEHINPEKINKMRVKLATQVFSHRFAVATEHLAARNDVPIECRQLIDITLLLDNLFDSLNISSMNIPNGKVYKGPVRRNSPHHNLWVKAKTILKSTKFVLKQSKSKEIKASVVPSIKNFIKTIEGVEAIWKILFVKYRFDCLLTRNLNQDPVENFFGNIRSYGVRNIAPNSYSFEGAYKSLLLNNFSAPHSSRANCEQDSNKCLQNLKFFLTEAVETPDIPEHRDPEVVINENIINNVRIDDAGQSNYVCGWALTKYLKKVKCALCRNHLIDKNNKNKNNKFIKLREYTNDKRWLCYPNCELVECFHAIQNITHNYLKELKTKTQVLQTILSLIDIFVTLPNVCPSHTEYFIKYFVGMVVKLIICSWCRSINRILSGKIQYEGDDSIKLAAQVYNNKRKNYKNRK